jgi:DNA polymerase-3 subunit delta'
VSDDIIARIEAPRSAPELIGHETAVAALAEAWRSERLAHAWMLAGPPGIGKATLAWQFVRFVAAGGEQGGEQAGEGTLATDPQHPAVRQVIAGAYPDSRLVRRSYNPRPPHRFRTEITVDDVRAVGQFLRHTAAMGGWRTVIVDSADAMNINAQNALLKILEEPPPRTLLLLVCHAPSRLLPTVRSRCRTLYLRPLLEDQVATILAQQQPDLPAAERQLLARLADGAPGWALDLAEAGGLDLYRNLIDLLESLPALDAVQLHKTADRFAGTAGEPAYRTFVSLLQWWLGRAIRTTAEKAGATLDEVVPGEAALTMRLTERGLEPWLKAWEKVAALTSRAEAVNLDRKQVVLNAFFELATAARG